MSLVLSIFPGIDLLGRAFEEEGFCIVRGPDHLWGGEIKTFHPPAGVFDGVIGGPPCQMFSAMKRLNPACGEKIGNLIPEFERVVAEARPQWFVMENVPGAPTPVVNAYGVHTQFLRDVWVGGETSRPRSISFGSLLWANRSGTFPIETLALHRPDPEPAVLSSYRKVPVALGGSRKRKKTADGARHGPADGPRMSIADMFRLQGVPTDFLIDAPFTVDGKRKAIANGVPIPMGRAIARAVKRVMAPEAVEVG